MRTVLIDLQPWRVSPGERVDLYLGDSPSAIGFGLGGQVWEPALITRPVLTAELFNLEIDGKIQPGRATFTFSARKVQTPTDAATLDYQGAPILIYTADDLTWENRVLEFTGYVSASRLDPETLSITIDAESSVKMIELPLLWKHFDGGGDLGGQPELRGEPKPAGFGVKRGIEPVWFDDVNNIGMIDGYGNLVSVDRLLEAGSDMGPPVKDYATYAALIAGLTATPSEVVKGSWATCIAEGIIVLGAPAAGVMTADCTFGAAEPGAWMLRIIKEHCGVIDAHIQTSTFDALTTAVEAVIGEATTIGYWTKEQRQCRDLLETAAGSFNASLLVTFDGKLAVTRAVASAAVGTLNRNGSTEPRVLKWKSADSISPFYRIVGRAGGPARVLSRSEVNFADELTPRGFYKADQQYKAGDTVFLPDGSEWLHKEVDPTTGVAPPDDGSIENATWYKLGGGGGFYADGTPVDDLRPEEVGANKTETRVSSGIEGQGGLATQDDVQLGTGGTVLTETGSNATDVALVTSLGTALGFFGQGLLATLNGIDLGPLGQLFGQDGTTHLTDAMLITLLGTSAAILGQGALATLSALLLGGGNLFGSNGTTPLTDANVLTALGTALAIASQGALATLSILLLGAGRLFQSNGTTQLSDLTVLTALGTAAAIAAQGALATLSVLLLGGGRLFASNGSTALTDAAVLTSLGTALAIIGQGLLATANAVLWQTQVTGTGKPSDYAGTTVNLIGSAGTPAITGNSVILGTGGAAYVAEPLAGSAHLSFRRGNSPEVGFTTAPTGGNTSPFYVGTFSDQLRIYTTASGQVAGAFTFGQSSWCMLTYDNVQFKAYIDGVLVYSLGAASGLKLFAFMRQSQSASDAVYDVRFSPFMDLNWGSIGGSNRPADNADVTATHTALAILSQGALATLSSLLLGGTRLFQSNGTTALTDASTVTSLGTASAIVSQGALATLSTLLLGGGRLFQSNGSTQLSDSSVVTALGTALAIISQGALATLSTLALGGGRLFQSNGTTQLADATVVTALGTALAIISQGALATLSSLALGGGRLFQSNGSTQLTDALVLTALGTALAIAGQGALATLNAANWQTQVAGTGKPSDYAGSTVVMAVRSGSPNIIGNTVAFVQSTSDSVYVTEPIGGPSAISFRRSNGPMIGFFVGTGVGANAPFIAQTFSNQLRLYSRTGGVDTQIGSAFNFPQTSWCMLTYDQIWYRAYVDGALLMQTAASVGTTHYCVASYSLQIGDQISDLRFTPYNDGNWATIGGTGRPADNADVTATHTALAIASQGALATLSSLLLGGGRLLQSNGTTSLTDASTVTSLGTASAIASQGALATLSSLLLGGGRLFQSNGSTALTDALVVTALGTALAIAGQGALATLSAVNWSSQVSGTGKPQDGAARNITRVYTDSQYQPTAPTGNGIPSGWRTTPSPPWTPVTVNVTMSNGNTQFSKSGGTDGVYSDASFRSTELLPDARLSFKYTAFTKGCVIGLNSDPATDNDYTSIDFAFSIGGDGNIYLFRNGTIQNGGVAVTVGAVDTKFTIEKIGTNIVFSKADSPFWTMTGVVGSTATLALDSAFGYFGQTIYELDFRSNSGNPTWISYAEQDASGTTYTSWSTPAREADPLTQAKTQNLGATGRVTSTRDALNSNNNFGLRSLSSAPGMSASVGGTATVTFDANGALISDTGEQLSLPSASFPGLAFNTRYFFYRNMLTPTAAGAAGGSYGVSTDLTTALGTTKVYVGTYLTPSSGGTGGGGDTYGGDNCVCPDSFVPVRNHGTKRAADIEPGDEIMVLSQDLRTWVWSKVVANALSTNFMVTITTESGIRLRLAVNTPMTQPDGQTYEIAGNCTGRMVAVLAMGVFRWEKVEKVEAENGELPCSMIHCDNGTYAAGVGIGNYVFSHNVFFQQKP